MNPKQKSALSKIFALSGAILLWAPIAFMIVVAVVGSIAGKQFRFDYLMLAELFPIVALGLVLLILAGILSKTFVKWFAWGAGAALASLVAGQLIATASGLASGATARSGPMFAVVIASIVVYNVIIVALFVLSIELARRLFRKKQEEADSAA
jgi:hypothetical protein